MHLTIKNDFVFTSEIHSRLLRSSSNFQLYTPRPNTELFRNSFIFSGTLIWNSIAEYINTASSVKHFKTLYLRWYKQSFEGKFCVHDTIQCVSLSSRTCIDCYFIMLFCNVYVCFFLKLFFLYLFCMFEVLTADWKWTSKQPR